jgi:FtsZ-binding cell division protein ZapB
VVRENDKLKEHNEMLFGSIDNLQGKIECLVKEISQYKDRNDNLEKKLGKLIP